MSDINLLPPEIRVLEKKSRFAKWLTLGGGVALALSTLAIVIITVIYLVGTAALSLAQANVDSATSDIASYQSLETTTAEITSKYQELQDIFKTRELYSKFFDSLSGMVPQDVSISEINFLADNKVSISGESVGYLSLAGFVKTLEDPATSKIFVNPALSSVVLNSQTGKAQFVMELGIKEGSLLLK